MALQPMPLQKRALPFDDPNWVFELKYDGGSAGTDSWLAQLRCGLREVRLKFETEKFVNCMCKGFICVFLLFASAAYPCSCAGPIPVCSAFWTTPLVFVGHVTSQPLIDDRYEVHFYVPESFKGIARQEIIVRTYAQGSMCGFKFEDGSEYLVYAYSENGEWWTNTCARTHKIESVNDDADVQWIHDLAKAPKGGTIFGTIQSFSPGTDLLPPQFCSHFFMFRPPGLLASPIVPTAATYRRRAAEAFTSEQNMLRCLRMHRVC